MFSGTYPKLKSLPLSTNISEEVSYKIRVITVVVRSGKPLLSYLGSAGLHSDVRKPPALQDLESQQSTRMPASVSET